MLIGIDTNNCILLLRLYVGLITQFNENSSHF